MVCPEPKRSHFKKRGKQFFFYENLFYVVSDQERVIDEYPRHAFGSHINDPQLVKVI
jgi:hypothetical protein